MSASPEPDFATVSDADATYYGSEDGGGGGTTDGGGSQRWGELQRKPTDWIAGWSLVYQEAVDDPALKRWFVIRVNPETEAFEALTMTGEAREYPEDASLDELPHTNDEQEAVAAYETWAEANGGQQEAGEGNGSEWGEWTKVQQVGDWWVFAREHKSEDRTQYLAAGKLDDGTAVYLHPDGSPKPSVHIYDSADALQKALDAYAQKKEAGQIPEDEQPTGNAPTNGEVRGAAGGPGGRGPAGPVGGLVAAVGGPRNAAIIGIAAAGGLYYAESRGYIDVTEAI